MINFINVNDWHLFISDDKSLFDDEKVKIFEEVYAFKQECGKSFFYNLKTWDKLS